MFTITAVKQLLKRGVKVELLCCAESRIHIEANNLGLIIHPVKASGYIHPFTTIRVASIISKGSFNIIHTQASKDLWLIVPALKLIRSQIPLILTKQIGSFIVKKDALHRWIYKRVTFALAISNMIKQNLLETCPLTEEKVLLLHNAVDTNRFDPAKADGQKVRAEFNTGSDKIILGMIARFSPGKGHEEFLAAAKALNEKFNNLVFMIVGEASRGEDEYANNIKQLAADYGSDNVIFTGFRSDTPDVLAAMDIFIFPSHAEAFGIALAEAMAMGKPSVCANADGVLDIAVDNETSLLFENKNAEDLAQKTEMLILDKGLREKFSKAARERIVKNFDLEVLTDKALEIYNRAVKE